MVFIHRIHICVRKYEKNIWFQIFNGQTIVKIKHSFACATKKGQKIAFFDKIKPKNEPKNQVQMDFFAWKVGPAIIFKGTKKFSL